MALTERSGRGFITGGVSDETPDWLGSYNEGMNAALNQTTARLGQQQTRQNMAQNAAAEARRAQEFDWSVQDRAREEAAWGSVAPLSPYTQPQGPALGPMPTLNVQPPVAPYAGLMEEGTSNQPAPLTQDAKLQLLPEWARMEQAEGLPPNYLETISMLESSGGVNFRPGSKYVGIFQVGPEVAADFGVTPEQLKDPHINSQVAAKLAGRNARQLREVLGRDPQPWEIYLAHQQGVGGASALLRSPGMNAVDALTAAYGGDRSKAMQAVTQNGGNPQMTAGEFAALWARKFGGALPQPFTGSPGVQTAGAPPFQPDPNRSRLANTVGAANAAAQQQYEIEAILADLWGSQSSPIGWAADAIFGTEAGLQQREARDTKANEAMQWYQNPDVQNWLKSNPDILKSARANPVAVYDQYKTQTMAPATAEAPSEKGDMPAGLLETATAAPAAPLPAPAVAAPAVTQAAPEPGLALPTPTGEVVPPVTRGEVAGVTAPGQGTIAQQIMRTPAGQQTALPDMGAYIAEPAAINAELFGLQQARQLLQQQYDEAVRFRDRAAMVEIRGKAMEIDAATRLMENMQAVAAMQAGDDNAVAQTLSRLSNGALRIQPVSTGVYNIFYNGQMTYQNVSKDALIAALRMEFDQQFQAQAAERAKLAGERETKILESQLKTNENIQTREADAYKQMAIDNNKQRLDAMFPESIVQTGTLPDGSTGFFVQPKIGGGQPRVFTMQPVMGVDGQPLIVGGQPKYKLAEYGMTNTVPVQ